MEADLTLLAALAARDSAIQEQQLDPIQGCRLFTRGYTTSSRMGKLGEIRKNSKKTFALPIES